MENNERYPNPSGGSPLLFISSGLLVLLACAYVGTWRSPFLLDDFPSVVENPTIRAGALAALSWDPPEWSFTAGRPLLNWSFALDHSWSGLNPAGYRLGNLLIHVANGFLGFWLILQILIRIGVTLDNGRRIALGAVSLWLLNPINTVCVTYVSQRAESLMALFYLTTVGSTLRGLRSSPSIGWSAIGGAAFCGGVLTKETIVTAPLVSLLLIRFLRGPDGSPFRTTVLHLLFIYAPGLLLFSAISVSSGLLSRGGIPTLDWSLSEYLIIQVRAWGEYVRLAIWPAPLIFDRGTTAASLSQFPVWVGLLGLPTLFFSVAGLLRRKPAGLPGTFFLVLLLPTTSLLPVVGAPIAENRLYLPLICSCVAASALIHRFLPRFFTTVLACLTLIFGFLSYQRNVDFTSAESIWRDTIAKAPLNHRAHGSLGVALLSKPEGATEGLEHLRESVRLEPREAETHYQIGVAQIALGALQPAESSLRECLSLQPSHSMAHAQLGLLLMRSGKVADSVPLLRKAVELRPERVDFRIALGAALYNRGEALDEAIACLETAVRVDPGNHEAWLHLGLARSKDPRVLAKAIEALEQAIRLKPASAEGWIRLGRLLQGVPGREAEARACLERAASMTQQSQPR